MKKKKFIPIIILFASFCLASPSSNANLPKSSQDTIKVAVSIAPQIEWLEEIGGDFIEVQSLIPIGQSPHSYSPSSEDLIFVAEADIWFQIGLLEFDIAYEDEILDNAGFNASRIINLSIEVDLFSSIVHELDETEHEEEIMDEGIDPHIWLSPSRTISMVEKIRDTLIQIDNIHSDYYDANADLYITKLLNLNESITMKTQEIKNRNILIFHPSWLYFADDYNFNLIALEDEGKDPTSEHFREIIELVEEKNISTIFIQEEISKSVADAFKEEVGVQIVQLSPLSKDYITNLNLTASIFQEKLDQPRTMPENKIWILILFFTILLGLLIFFSQIYKSKLDESDEYISKNTELPVLEVKNLHFSFNSKNWALQDIDIRINNKEFVGIIGPNGGGKTTFLKLILGILHPQQGEIKLFGEPVKKSRRKIGYFPQMKKVDTDFPIKVKEVIMGARLKPQIINFFTKKDKKIVDDVMKTLDIYELKERKLNELSGGQLNRVFLARALACEPELLVLDEPMAGLDVTLQRLFLNTIKSLNKEMTILIVDHNLKLLEKYVDKFICLNRCVAHGTSMHTIKDLPNHLESGECFDDD